MASPPLLDPDLDAVCGNCGKYAGRLPFTYEQVVGGYGHGDANHDRKLCHGA